MAKPKLDSLQPILQPSSIFITLTESPVLYKANRRMVAILLTKSLTERDNVVQLPGAFWRALSPESHSLHPSLV